MISAAATASHELRCRVSEQQQQPPPQGGEFLLAIRPPHRQRDTDGGTIDRDVVGATVTDDITRGGDDSRGGAATTLPRPEQQQPHDEERNGNDTTTTTTLHIARLIGKFVASEIVESPSPPPTSGFANKPTKEAISLPPAATGCRYVDAFDVPVPPDISLAAYYERLTRLVNIDAAPLIASVVLLQRATSRSVGHRHTEGNPCKAGITQFHVTPYNAHRLALAAVVVACKNHADVFYPMSCYAGAGGVKTGTLLDLEIVFFSLLQYNAYVSEAEFERVCGRVGARLSSSRATRRVVVVAATRRIPNFSVALRSRAMAARRDENGGTVDDEDGTTDGAYSFTTTTIVSSAAAPTDRPREVVRQPQRQQQRADEKEDQQCGEEISSAPTASLGDVPRPQAPRPPQQPSHAVQQGQGEQLEKQREEADNSKKPTAVPHPTRHAASHMEATSQRRTANDERPTSAPPTSEADEAPRAALPKTDDQPATESWRFSSTVVPAASAEAIATATTTSTAATVTCCKVTASAGSGAPVSAPSTDGAPLPLQIELLPHLDVDDDTITAGGRSESSLSPAGRRERYGSSSTTTAATVPPQPPLLVIEPEASGMTLISEAERRSPTTMTSTTSMTQAIPSDLQPQDQHVSSKNATTPASSNTTTTTASALLSAPTPSGGGIAHHHSSRLHLAPAAGGPQQQQQLLILLKGESSNNSAFVASSCSESASSAHRHSFSSMASESASWGNSLTAAPPEPALALLRM